MRKAVVDVGSNSVLLTVEEFDGLGWRPVCETSEVTALGEGTKQTGLLSERAMIDTLRAIAQAHETARAVGSAPPIVAATMAARIAKNVDAFLARAASQRTPVVVLSGDAEAELGLLAVTDDPQFSKHDKVSIVDPGGHSTELATAEREGSTWTDVFRRSFAVGTLALRGSSLASEALNSGELLRAAVEIDSLLDVELPPGAAGVAVVLGATGTNLVSIREGLTHWDPGRVHGAYLSYEEVGKASGWLSRLTDAERAAVPGMEPGRERTIHIGALILERFLHLLHADGCFVSVRGWRHALLERGMPSHLDVRP